ncbi:hypothetical protein LCGC14_1043160 [marine sediment metagenome]|uniref:Uncharacterized protein n=1 Tax=marine sediment metagenome TaxID=412755 RepID=A0A0F9MVL3_9ZZZZ
MVARYDAQSLLARFKCRMADWNPDGVAKVIVDLVPASSDELLPIARSKRFLFGIIVNTTGATPNDLEEFEVIAATDADGTGATVVKAHALGSTPDAIGDTVWLEVDVKQIREVLATATHVGVRAEVTTTTSQCTIVIIEERMEEHNSLTADYVS